MGKNQYTTEILRAIEEFATEGIQITDEKGIYIFCNQAFASITGVPIEERLGHSIWDGQEEGACAMVLQTGRPVYGHVYSPHERPGVVLVVNAAPILNRSGKMVGVITVFNDQANYISLAQKLKENERRLQQLQNRISMIARPAYSFQDLYGEDPVFLECIRRAEQAAKSDASVLITGESGTGKELFAHAIHSRSLRDEGPFISVNCPAIPGNLLESELFGYEKGAFTGADKQKPGKFELAQGGTIFLDEIGDMDITLQAKLLRVLQQRETERVGSLKPIPLDVRVIAATNRDLKKQIEEGKFREDLYYRLNVINVQVPPLRKRKSDIPLILYKMLEKHSRGLRGIAGTNEAVRQADDGDSAEQANIHGASPQAGVKMASLTVSDDLPTDVKLAGISISDGALEVFQSYDWPGNVRELENTAERLLLYRSSGTVTAEDAMSVLGFSEKPLMSGGREGMTLAEMEKQMIQAAMKKYGWSLVQKRKAAAELGISLSTLYEKLKKYGIRNER